MSSAERCIIVGGGHAAAQLCAELAKTDWPGRVIVISDEPELPYHRPPLSKACLDPDAPAPLQAIRPASFYQDHRVEFILNQSVQRIDCGARQVTLGDGGTQHYDTLVLATGSLHRRPPIRGIEHPRVFSLRTAQDAASVRDRLAEAESVAVIGAGFIGLEVAASVRKAGRQVTIFEAAERALSRVTSPEVSAFFQDLHRGHGADLRLGQLVSAIDEREGRLALLDQDQALLTTADLVVVGAGAMPNTRLADEAGLKIDNGIAVDETNRTSDPHVYALGDCCSQHHALYDVRLRIESVQNAADQAKNVAASLAGQAPRVTTMPWFWSDQYDVKLQIAGVSTGYDRCVVRGDPQAGPPFSVWYVRQGRLIAVDAVNDPRAYAVAGKIIPTLGCPDLNLVADADTDLKSVLQSAKENDS